ncbi:hypothetical protein ACJJTC_017689 [Scirpophaga incertulas]
MGKSTHVDGDNNPTTSPEPDPTKLLEAALLQMDGIIAEAGGTTALTSGPGRAARARALELAQQLASSLQHAIPPPPRPDFTTASAILRWLQQNNNSVALNDAEERVRRLEADKESLQLQVQVLSEQIAAQSEKMNDLERSLHDARQRLDDADQRLQKEMLQRSSLETQKLELLSKLSEVRLRVAERGLLERSPPPEVPLVRPAPPRTPPANYGRQIERNTHAYSSLPRAAALERALGKPAGARGRGHSVPNLAEKDEVIPRGSPSPSLREVRARLGSGGGGVRLEGGDVTRESLRSSAPRPRLLPMPWQTTDVRQWDCETTCGWLESLGLEPYVPAAKAWLSNSSPGTFASASHSTIEKELAIRHPMHRKKIVLALTDLLVSVYPGS